MADEHSRMPATSREKLLHALYEAAELEQNLMCTYLYAAFSLKDGDDGLAPAEAEAVARWRKAIIGVAIDEMSHLVAVWNITAALGAAPRFGRTNFPLAPGYLPAGVVVKLAPFGDAVLQHLVHLERPEGSDEPDGAGFAPEAVVTRTPVAPRLTPAGYDYETVGVFYRTIASDLRLLVDRYGEAAAFPGDPGLQMSSAEVALGGARQVTDLTSALAAIDEIIVEGEGAPSHTADSHFQSFLSIREEYRAFRISDSRFEPAHPAACNPVLRKPPRAEGRVWIEDADAAATVDLANATYALTLRLLAASYTLSGPSSDKALYVDVAIGLMQALTPLAERAARLPAGPSNPGSNAGVSFTALRDAASLPSGPAMRPFMVERIAELTEVVEGLDPADRRCADAARTLRSLSDRLRTAPAARERPAGLEATPPASPAPAQSIPAAETIDGIDRVEGADVTVMYDGKRCIHARFCVTLAPATFLANVEGPWIVPDATAAEDVSTTVRQCPSGALTFLRRDDHDEKAPPVNLVTLRENGPYAIHADLSIDGRSPGYRATLCRCGASRNKPFCDKSHKYVGFVATGDPAGRDTPLLVVRDGPVEVSPQLDGPLAIRGNLEIMSGTGRTLATVRATRLCRCGGSATKPFCDDSHRTNGFRST